MAASVAVILVKVFNLSLDQVPISGMILKADSGMVMFALIAALLYFLMAFCVYYFVDVKSASLTNYEIAAAEEVEEEVDKCYNSTLEVASFVLPYECFGRSVTSLQAKVNPDVWFMMLDEFCRKSNSTALKKYYSIGMFKYAIGVNWIGERTEKELIDAIKTIEPKMKKILLWLMRWVGVYDVLHLRGRVARIINDDAFDNIFSSNAFVDKTVSENGERGLPTRERVTHELVKCLIDANRSIVFARRYAKIKYHIKLSAFMFRSYIFDGILPVMLAVIAVAAAYNIIDMSWIKAFVPPLTRPAGLPIVIPT